MRLKAMAMASWAFLLIEPKLMAAPTKCRKIFSAGSTSVRGTACCGLKLNKERSVTGVSASLLSFAYSLKAV